VTLRSPSRISIPSEELIFTGLLGVDGRNEELCRVFEQGIITPMQCSELSRPTLPHRPLQPRRTLTRIDGFSKYLDSNMEAYQALATWGRGSGGKRGIRRIEA
jgi:hypothetical protein